MNEARRLALKGHGRARRLKALRTALQGLVPAMRLQAQAPRKHQQERKYR